MDHLLERRPIFSTPQPPATMGRIVCDLPSRTWATAHRALCPALKQLFLSMLSAQGSMCNSLLVSVSSTVPARWTLAPSRAIKITPTPLLFKTQECLTLPDLPLPSMEAMRTSLSLHRLRAIPSLRTRARTSPFNLPLRPWARAARRCTLPATIPTRNPIRCRSHRYGNHKPGSVAIAVLRQYRQHRRRRGYERLRPRRTSKPFGICDGNRSDAGECDAGHTHSYRHDSTIRLFPGQSRAQRRHHFQRRVDR